MGGAGLAAEPVSACLMIGALAVTLATGEFTLEWQHSVEKTGWRETWAVDGDRLRLTEAAVQGSGAGMDPGDGAVLRGDWWVWTPTLPPVPQLLLGASGATGGGWRLCADGTCQVVGADPSPPVRLAPCPP